MNTLIAESWKQALASEFEKPYFTALTKKVQTAYQSSVVFPPTDTVFTAFTNCPLERVRVVILGQDPYHAQGQAHGLAFSVRESVTIPPSLRNIYKEITSDIGIPTPTSGDLTRWATQGVLLLNCTLSVMADSPRSHHGWGWENFTDAVIETISKERNQVVFLLWGATAISKRLLIDEGKHQVLTAPHPSPLSAYRGFFGCRHFSKTNHFLKRTKQQPIVW